MLTGRHQRSRTISPQTNRRIARGPPQAQRGVSLEIASGGFQAHTALIADLAKVGGKRKIGGLPALNAGERPAAHRWHQRDDRTNDPQRSGAKRSEEHTSELQSL